MVELVRVLQCTTIGMYRNRGYNVFYNYNIIRRTRAYAAVLQAVNAHYMYNNDTRHRENKDNQLVRLERFDLGYASDNNLSY